KEAYEKGHLPGAVWVDEAAAQKLAATKDGLNDGMAWAAWSSGLAIGRDTEVVVYGNNRQLSAARVWWLLTYLGVPRVGLLDGNYDQWEKEGHPTSTEAASVKPKIFPIVVQNQRHATREDVLSAVKDKRDQVIDARTQGEFTGAEAKSKRGGHIPE